MRVPVAVVCAFALLLSGCTPAPDSAVTSDTSATSSVSSPAPSPTPVSSTQPTAATGGWLPSADIPLDSEIHWPALADSAQPVTSPRLRFEDLCHSTIPEYREHLESQGYEAKRAQPPTPEGGSWQVQQTIFTWQPDPADPHGGDNGRYFFNELQSELGECGSATVKLGSDGTSLSYRVPGPGDGTTYGHLVWAQGYCALSDFVMWAESRQDATWTDDDSEATNAALDAALRTGPRCKG